MGGAEPVVLASWNVAVPLTGLGVPGGTTGSASGTGGSSGSGSAGASGTSGASGSGAATGETDGAGSASPGGGCACRARPADGGGPLGLLLLMFPAILRPRRD